MGVNKRLSEQAQHFNRVRNQERRMARMMGKSSESARLINIESISETEKYSLAQDAERMEEYHQKIEAWQKETIQSLRASLSSFGINNKSISESLSPTARKDKYGIINRIGFSFAREAVYLHRGAGRGYGGNKGSTWSYVKQIKGNRINTSIIRHTKPESLGKMNTGNRQAKPWFDTVINARLENLANIVSEYWTTMAIDATNIFIEK